ncbi:MAG: hypothetical protein BroJett014_07550 [Planctomycetota bacterium]|nr:MAG: hypothetical protein BroJett014_07550 [Planctomycetota bacterium]
MRTAEEPFEDFLPTGSCRSNGDQAQAERFVITASRAQDSLKALTAQHPAMVWHASKLKLL